MGKGYYYQLAYDKWLAKDRLMRQPALLKGVCFIFLLKMSSSPIKGHLLDDNNNPYPDEELAMLAGCSIEELADAREKLVNIGVFKNAGEKERKWVACQDIIDSESDRNKAKAYGKKGGRPPKNDA